jgi:hypothetical protein
MGKKLKTSSTSQMTRTKPDRDAVAYAACHHLPRSDPPRSLSMPETQLTRIAPAAIEAQEVPHGLLPPRLQ